jgi:glycosyltransferase involved in cell wall biosynthesis
VKKILFIVTQSEFGGAQRYIFEMGRLLDRNKYQIKAAAGSGDGELFRKLEEISVPSKHLEKMKRAPNPFQVISAIKEMRDTIKTERPDVLFLCSTTAGILGSLAAISLKTKVIYRIGGWAFNDPRPFWQNSLISLAERATSRLKNAIIVNSEFDWRIAVKKKIASPEKIVKIYNGLNPDSLEFYSKEEARSKLNLNESGRIVGTVANFYKTKGLEHLIKAAKEIIKENSQTKFVIVGEGRLRSKLEKMIKKYGLENNVFLKGRIPNAYKHLKAFDAFVLPSLKEGFPWIILEAMAAELPIIATKVGALPEIINDKEDGLLVEPGSSQELAERIKELLKNPDAARAMGIRAKAKLVEKFSPRKMAEKTEEVVG